MYHRKNTFYSLIAIQKGNSDSSIDNSIRKNKTLRNTFSQGNKRCALKTMKHGQKKFYNTKSVLMNSFLCVEACGHLEGTANESVSFGNQNCCFQELEYLNILQQLLQLRSKHKMHMNTGCWAVPCDHNTTLQVEPQHALHKQGHKARLSHHTASLK